LAITEKADHQAGFEVSDIVDRTFKKEEIFEMGQLTQEQRSLFFEPVFEAAAEPPVKEPEMVEGPEEEELPVVPVPELRRLNEAEEQRLRRKEEALLRELRIFLRSAFHLSFPSKPY
jgi:8-oxo-dGTP pyrophosphatase MutT (NUDIX family)